MKKRKQLILLAVVVGILVIFGRSGFLGVNKVDTQVNNARCTSVEEIKSASGLLSSNILFINEGVISNKLSERYPCIKFIKLEKKFPKTVLVIVEGRESFVRLSPYREVALLDLNNPESTPSSQSALLDWSLPSLAPQQFLIDKNGVVFAVSQNENLPLLFIPEESLKVGQKLGGELFNNIAIIFQGLNGLGIVVTETKITGEDLLILSPQKITFSLQKEAKRQIISLQLILQKAKIDGRMMDVIDLRFDKAVVRYLPKK